MRRLIRKASRRAAAAAKEEVAKAKLASEEAHKSHNLQEAGKCNLQSLKTEQEKQERERERYRYIYIYRGRDRNVCIAPDIFMRKVSLSAPVCEQSLLAFSEDVHRK